jgi:hypothetical protein
MFDQWCAGMDAGSDQSVVQQKERMRPLAALPFSDASLVRRLRLPLPAPAEQTKRAEAGDEESSRERPRGRASARASLHKRYTQCHLQAVCEGIVDVAPLPVVPKLR